MLTNDRSASAPFLEAVNHWKNITDHDDCAFTIKAIFVATRMALTKGVEDGDEMAAVLQLLCMGEMLADIEYCRGDYEYDQAQKGKKTE